MTVHLIETHPQAYDGGLPMCAPLGPAVACIKTVVFDPLVLFELWFPNELPSPADVPADYVMTLGRAEHLTRLLDANPTRATALRARSSVRTNEELGRFLDLYTYILGELAHRWGGNAFDNRDTVYTNLGDDEAVNDGVKRYAADPAAQKLAVAHYTPTGRLERPMLHVRTVYDPLLSAFSSERYTEATHIAGKSELFAQKYVKGARHCEIRPEERRAALEELRRWKSTGQRPSPGLLTPPAGPPRVTGMTELFRRLALE